MQHIPKVILIIETSRAFGRRLLLGITKYARLHGPWAFYREPGGLQSNFPKLKDWHADGIIIRDTNICKQLFDLNKPTILVPHNREMYGEYPTIKTNGETISKMAADHLLDKGLKNFGYCGFDDFPWSRERQEHFKKYLNNKNFYVSIFSQSKSPSKRKWEREQTLMAEWLKSLPKPVGIMACNDDRGQHVIESCKLAELHIPEEVAVIGVDNDDLICDLCDPPLSSVTLNVEKAGYEAAKLLDNLMRGDNPINKSIIVNPLYIRARYSTDIIATEDFELTKAISFIRKNFRRGIQVGDVVESTTLSRRSLEQRFRKKLSRSINSEIRRVRIEHICKLLVETDLPISEIAYGLGFSSVEHISRYFKREAGKSLRDFRKIKASN
jgi:LacI family transcriptional regulator, galactose operon repressor